MASQTYISQTQKLSDNLNSWSDFIDAISQILNNYDQNIEYIKTQLDSINSRIANLEVDVSTFGALGFEHSAISVPSSAAQKHTQNIAIFNNNGIKSIYVYANKDVARMTINGNPVKNYSNGECLCIQHPSRTEFLNIETDNVPIITGLQLCVSTDDPSKFTWPTVINNDVLSISIAYQASSTNGIRPGSTKNISSNWKVGESQIIGGQNIQTSSMIVNSLKP